MLTNGLIYSDKIIWFPSLETHTWCTFIYLKYFCLFVFYSSKSDESNWESFIGAGECDFLGTEKKSV